MTTARFLKARDIVPWLEALSKDYVVFAPTRHGDSVVFREFEPERGVELDQLATTPAKKALLPPCETLFEFQTTKTDTPPYKTSIELTPTISQDRIVVFGTRPCDARAMQIFDRVYDGEQVKDPYYTARRKNATIVSLACTELAASCFCDRVGSSPVDATGSDILLTPLKAGYVAEALTEKGQQLLKDTEFMKADGLKQEALNARTRIQEHVPERESFLGMERNLLSLFGDMGFWDKTAEACLSCGACTYLCPTCYCFNITDEQRGDSGKRIRTWDNCMSNQFTLEGSGHNPRPSKAHRMRNRIGHKFSYYPQLHDKTLACVGCGRCISNCPVSFDIRNAVACAITQSCAAQEHAHD